ncbi:endonuclease/exonuclease/phosphatase family protein [Sphingobacterium sp. SGG-5]|uniref:endonuclease/exonuclease/phosphatase family protein n=1 Tax=Sphingobacterium sp. SGG-5 TaxID=2710881 RepID=UPI0013EA7482|nr:endonuclease/exonuclease/phosphatase family protein [Sphingobacterium sp. SGG-5]NGM63217.1 endonuclease/exonuclease/phosphatase family protein [Sphingobacterium sp. SGG-5]
MKHNSFILSCLCLFLCVGGACTKTQQPKGESDTSMEEATTIRLATYNIRSNFGSDTQDWDTRLASLDALFQKYNFDIIGVQEPYQRQIDDLMELYGDTYDYYVVNTGNVVGGGVSHSNPVFWRKSRFTLQDKGVFWFSTTPEVEGSVSWDASQARNCVWVKLYDNEYKLSLFVFNVHFDHESTVARNNSAGLLVDKVKAIAGAHLTLCTGDFNTNQNTTAFATLTTSDVLIDTHPIAEKMVNDDYKTNHGYTVIPPEEGSLRIDHVLISKLFPKKVKLWQCVIDNFNGNWASDHYPVFIDLDLN